MDDADSLGGLRNAWYAWRRRRPTGYIPP